jgi:alanine racemase
MVPVARVELGRIRGNAHAIRTQVGPSVGIYAVIKADAYGLGAKMVSEAITDQVDAFCVFALREAVEADLWQRTGQPAIPIGPPESLDPAPYLAQHVRPAVSTVEQAMALKAARPILCVDTGMQRFACRPEHIDAVIAAGGIDEAFTHATTLAQVRRLVDLAGGRGLKLHAAGSSLLDEREARLDTVRPGLALYCGAVTLSVALAEVIESRGPVGYSRFVAARHGVILCGYAAGLRRGPCLVNGQRRRIIEVGMQSAYLEAAASDLPGDRVILLGGGLEPQEIAAAWGSTPHEALLRLTMAGIRQYS